MRRAAFAFLVLVAAVVAVLAADSKAVIKNQGFLPFADAPIYYRSAVLDDPIARLEKRLEHGDASLGWEPRHGYLKSVLDALHVPLSSQTLVFSKTSFQFPLITPSTPRALYYNDDIYVGQVHQAKFLEFVSFDPRQGAIFYVLDERRSDSPRFERAAVDCVQCHVAPATKGIPGVMVRSVFTRPSGYPAGGTKSFVTGQESPWDERWGGWYVTALSGASHGMGNALSVNSASPEQLEGKDPPNTQDLRGHIDTASYAASTSDLVALLVLAHQTQMHNLITLTNYRTRLGGDHADYQAPAEQLLRYLLFANELPLPEPVTGNSTFAKDFEARGPFDSHRRSLRQFDLKTRIFRYPCSYLIYSETFDAIPEPAKAYIYRRLLEVLSGRDQSADFQNLSAVQRQAILEILVETKPGLPPEWKQFFDESQQTSRVQPTPHQP
jgi:hypothetical protein